MASEMERLIDRLRVADQHIALGLEHIATIEKNMTELPRDGFDAACADELLVTLRETQGLYEADRKSVLRQIEDLWNSEF